jgi:membrane protein YdbS with pleckstrin-like domain
MQLLRVLIPTEPVEPAKAISAEWRQLPLKSRRASELGGAVGSMVVAGVLIGGAIIVSIVKEWQFFPKSYVAFLVLWSAFGFYRGYLEWAHTSWCLDSALRIRRGRWWRSETIVPRVRIQHLDLSRGPLERTFGLATLTVFTAGSTLSSVSLGGLDDATAVGLRDALLPATAEDERDGI